MFFRMVREYLISFSTIGQDLYLPDGVDLMQELVKKVEDFQGTAGKVLEADSIPSESSLEDLIDVGLGFDVELNEIFLLKQVKSHFHFNFDI